MSWERQYLIIKNKDSYLNWRLQCGDSFEIVGEIDDFYFLWAGGTSMAFPKYSRYEYEIKKEEINIE